MKSFDKTQIIKMADHVFKRSRGIPDKRLMHPRREWAIGIILFAIILIAGSAMSAQSFNRFRNIDTSNGEADITIPLYNQVLVTEVINEYSARAAEYKDLINDTSLVPEPVADPLEEVASSTAKTASSTELTSSSTERVFEYQ